MVDDEVEVVDELVLAGVVGVVAVGVRADGMSG